MTTLTAPHHDSRTVMNNMYRFTRHVYDASRKYYLFGRDQLIEAIQPRARQVVLEIGCGTARNLIKMARRYPGVQFYGIDASDEMLKTAEAAIARAGLSDRVHVAQAFAENVDPQALFGLQAPPDHIFFSYALSMIPPWREALAHARTLVRPDTGVVWIVDFADLKGLPAWFEKLLRFWLKLFHVTPRGDLLDALKNDPAASTTLGFGRYYLLTKITGAKA